MLFWNFECSQFFLSKFEWKTFTIPTYLFIKTFVEHLLHNLFRQSHLKLFISQFYIILIFLFFKSNESFELWKQIQQSPPLFTQYNNNKWVIILRWDWNKNKTKYVIFFSRDLYEGRTFKLQDNPALLIKFSSILSRKLFKRLLVSVLTFKFWKCE